ncbi:MAG TPA: YtxH domain-containing protein [Bryobacteraceae bacterium]|nr:YtxH domain-containing protein [Bryobacteraceae bacterium]
MADQEEAQDQLASNIGWFVVGTVVGMTAAILLAPQSGKKTRHFIAGKTQQGKDAVTETGKDVYDRSKEMIDKGRQLVEDAADLFERGRKLVRGE